MVEFIIFAIAGVSVTIVIAIGEIFNTLKLKLIKKASRSIDETLSLLLFCPMCIGVWVGMGLSFLMPHGIVTVHWLLTMLLCGAVVGTISHIIGKGVLKLDEL